MNVYSYIWDPFGLHHHKKSPVRSAYAEVVEMDLTVLVVSCSHKEMLSQLIKVFHKGTLGNDLSTIEGMPRPIPLASEFGRSEEARAGV
ncbi:hypothetical protein ISS39_08080 [Candidatus Bathyarchaeota archaeon]|nr:hypothetical protein [Candidatus Bathyarchaeota archaeon]